MLGISRWVGMGLLSLSVLLSACGGSEPSTEAEKNMAKATVFFEANQSKPGIQLLGNTGIQYEVLVSGHEDGKSPKLVDDVKIQYQIYSLDGKLYYDSTAEKKVPVIYIKQALLAWKKVLPNMTVGSKWRVYVPQHMAYSTQGHQGGIGPNESLMFDVELLEIIW